MNYRTLGRTGLRISEVGFGAWGIGGTSWIGADDVTSRRALMAARDAGINFFDSALAYGNGHSERLLAETFGKAQEIVVASKVPPKNHLWPAREGTLLRDVFPKEYVLASLQTTLRNLRRESIDLYQFHVWSDEWANDPEWLETVEEMRRSGLARFIGISVNDHQPGNVLHALETGAIDVVQVIYNIFDQSPEDTLFPCCLRYNLGVIARVPFDEGSLAGVIHPDVTFPAGDFRNGYFGGNRRREVWERVQRLMADAEITLAQLPDLALRFCLSHEAVNSVIPGMRNSAHVLRNAAASDCGRLPDELRGRINRHRWVRNFYAPPTGLPSGVGNRLRQVTSKLVPGKTAR
jgi:aryl-alcohol dehydrogenase-like predicted oxidoreductase